ncbi:MAG: 50S ribosomal protein L11 methyltransferase [bacterium]|nr:50S ribosomal protein L11 methyltransferase [bacterium]
MQTAYLEVIVKVNQGDEEMAGWLMAEEGALGIEELGLEAGKLTLKVFFPEDEELCQRALRRAQAGVNMEVGERLLKPVVDWQAYWKEHFKPLEVGRRFLVRPPWEKADPKGRVEIVINPGQGFGTGYHETTRLAMLALEQIEGHLTEPFLDIGTGSGILAIAALKLGAPSGVGLEIEQEALEELPSNLALSNLDPQLLVGHLAKPNQWDQPAQTVIANITGDVLLYHHEDLRRLTGRHLILSGILEPFLEPLKDRFSDWELVYQGQEGDWFALCFRRQG